MLRSSQERASERASEGGTERMRLLAQQIALTCCACSDDPVAGTCAGTVAAVLWTLPPALLGTAYIYVCIFVEVDHSFGAGKKHLFLSHFDRLNTINLPRQARDKHSILGNNLMLRDKAWYFLSACMQGSPISTCCARSRRWASVWWFSSGRSSAAASREGSPAARRRAACCDDGDRRDKKEPRGKS